MNKLVIVDEQMRAKLGKDESVAVCAADGTVLGLFIPAVPPGKANLHPEIDDEETAPRLPDGSRQYTTTEVLLHLLSQPRKAQ